MKSRARGSSERHSAAVVAHHRSAYDRCAPYHSLGPLRAQERHDLHLRHRSHGQAVGSMRKLLQRQDPHPLELVGGDPSLIDPTFSLFECGMVKQLAAQVAAPRLLACVSKTNLRPVKNTIAVIFLWACLPQNDRKTIRLCCVDVVRLADARLEVFGVTLQLGAPYQGVPKSLGD